MKNVIIEALFIAMLVGGGVGAIVLIRSFAFFDAFLRRMYADNHDEWARFGQPCGFRWVPPESRKHPFSAGGARSNMYTMICSKRVPYIGMDEEAARLQARTRELGSLAKQIFICTTIAFAVIVAIIFLPLLFI